MMEVWQVMKASVERGLAAEGILPGPLDLSRKAASFQKKVVVLYLYKSTS